MIVLLLAAGLDAPPTDWSTLPALPPAQLVVTDGAAFVRREVEARHCLAVSATGGDGSTLAVPVAMLVSEGGRVTRITPRAIGCATVEQYTAGYVQSVTRSMIAPDAAPGWYRLTVAYRW